MVRDFIADPEIVALNCYLNVSGYKAIEFFFKRAVSPDPPSGDYTPLGITIYYARVLNILIEPYRCGLRLFGDNGLGASATKPDNEQSTNTRPDQVTNERVGSYVTLQHVGQGLRSDRQEQRLPR